MTKAVTTAMKMIESLPETIQERVTDKLRELIEEEREELRWKRFLKRQGKFVGLIRHARKEIREGTAVEMEYERL